jgi:CheY-like chemotaxis protein
LKRILAVDDSPVILSLIKDVLTARDYSVETANDGQDALEKYAEFKPDVVTLDLTMPLMDGYQVLRQASYKLNFEGHAIPLDIQLWYDGGRIFA